MGCFWIDAMYSAANNIPFVTSYNLNNLNPGNLEKYKLMLKLNT